MTECRDLYSQCLRNGHDFGAAADEQFPDGRCERASVSEHSPGPVHHNEKLTRLVIHPIHMDSGKPVAVVFNDAWNSDLSLFREGKATDAEIRLALQKVPPQNRLFVGVMQTPAFAIRRALLDNGPMRAFRVYDTAEQMKPHHASVFMSKAGREQLTQKRVRKELWEIFGQVIAHEASTYRRGRLSMPTSTPEQQFRGHVALGALATFRRLESMRNLSRSSATYTRTKPEYGARRTMATITVVSP
jgi:hypothetical protein